MKIQVKQLQDELQAGKALTLIDVRTPVEHEEIHISGSELMPLDQLNPDEVKAATKNSKQCVIICGGGTRAGKAFQKLSAAGCENLVILEGGMTAWENAGYPVERSQKAGLPLMRQVQLVVGLLALLGSILALTVDKNFALIPAILGVGLTFAGATGWCGLAIALSKMPWNQSDCCQGNSCSL